MRSRRAFTLLEVMVATSIMGIAVVGIVSGLSTSVRNATRLLEYNRAALVARARMDSLLVDPMLPRITPIEGPIDASLLGGTNGGWRARLAPFDVRPATAPGAPVLERIELDVWWMAGDQRRSLKLEAFRRGQLRPGDAP